MSSEQDIELAPDIGSVDRNAIEQRLERLEQLLCGIAERFDRAQLVASQRNLFLWLVGAHSAAIAFVLALANNSNQSNLIAIAYGISVGSVVTIAVWQGISLRSFCGRWGRSLLATCVVLLPLNIIVSDDFAISVIPILIFYFSGILFVTRFMSGYTHIWLWSPDLLETTPRPITIPYFLITSLGIALLLSISRLIESDDPMFSFPMNLGYFLLGAIHGLCVSMSLRFFAWWQSVIGRICVALGLIVSLTVFNLLSFFVYSIWIAESKVVGMSLFAYIPVCLYSSASILTSPILTLYALLMNGQKLVGLDQIQPIEVGQTTVWRGQEC